ncbi:uncharacterized protein KGF55_001888 [Candida pseudojiufengensis]|uniref:uncharacterized protein n=1 Tax=Candida pseudojiufengensis TaxID=497109 RepID=UPI002224ABB5|nr:uncharacterized protein KGF55_001888 [Candida pseudojiufengensis]KAI5964818.1 hypothetical protein KGF55_001888 [Candida pseudojiufengensis]
MKMDIQRYAVMVTVTFAWMGVAAATYNYVLNGAIITKLNSNDSNSNFGLRWVYGNGSEIITDNLLHLKSFIHSVGSTIQGQLKPLNLKNKRVNKFNADWASYNYVNGNYNLINHWYNSEKYDDITYEVQTQDFISQQ